MLPYRPPPVLVSFVTGVAAEPLCLPLPSPLPGGFSFQEIERRISELTGCFSRTAS
jgi:hypothetical protein